ncbi:hypothetical protein ACSU64_18835 [Bacillaceae bacterium C204]|uniref:hypothetical protein n=1 Tax=Neobacillus sp. 204 TaxID=3383351 RepID=UPI00397C3207
MSIIWAFGSMIILMLIIFVIPLGFTFKGKLLAVLASFLLGLGGLAAASTFQLWETAMMLVALIFFTAYFMNKRIGTLLFKEVPLIEEELSDEYFFNASVSQSELEKTTKPFDLKDKTIVEHTLANVTDSRDLLTRYGLEKNIEDEKNLYDDDISFLLKRNLEDEVIENFPEIEPEIGYLSDIESLLVEALEEQVDQIEEINQSTTIIPNKMDFNYEDILIEDSTFDFLLAPKEVAVSKDEVLDEISAIKKISLQK